MRRWNDSNVAPIQTMTKTKMEEKIGDNVRAVGRALEILLAFTAQDHEMTVGELLKRVSLSRPTLYRLLYTLEQNGFLVSSGDPQRFCLGPAVARLAHAWTSSFDIAKTAQPILLRTWEETGETVALFVPQNGYRLCVSEIPSSQPLSFKRGVGYLERIGVGASGRALLAHATIAHEKLLAYAEQAGMSAERYDKELKATRTRGYAISREELIRGAAAVAAPFFDASGKVAGSIAIFGPTVRVDAPRVAELGRLLIGEAAAISAALGWESRIAP